MLHRCTHFLSILLPFIKAWTKACMGVPQKTELGLSIGGTIIPNAGAWLPPVQDLTEI